MGTMGARGQLPNLGISPKTYLYRPFFARLLHCPRPLPVRALVFSRERGARRPDDVACSILRSPPLLPHALATISCNTRTRHAGLALLVVLLLLGHGDALFGRGKGGGGGGGGGGGRGGAVVSGNTKVAAAAAAKIDPEALQAAASQVRP